MKIKTLLTSLVFLIAFPFIGNANELKIKIPSPETKLINPNTRRLHFEINIIDDREKPSYAEIQVSNQNSELLQSLPVEIWITDPYFEFIDINDDGYIDLLFYNSDAGMCCGATQGAEVYLYIPKLKNFLKSKTLTGKGNITKTKSKGCMNVNYKSSLDGYTDDEWCFNLKTGRWKMIKSTINEPSK